MINIMYSVKSTTNHIFKVLNVRYTIKLNLRNAFRHRT